MKPKLILSIRIETRNKRKTKIYLCDNNKEYTSGELSKLFGLTSCAINKRINQSATQGINDPDILQDRIPSGFLINGSKRKTGGSRGKGTDEYKSLADIEKPPPPQNTYWDDLMYQSLPAGEGPASLYVNYRE